MSYLRLIVPGLTPDQCVPIARVGKYPIYCLAVENALAGRCSFCPPDPVVNKVIVENASWLAWQSPKPEKHTCHHFIIVHKRHVIGMEELDDFVDGALFFAALRELRAMHNIVNNGILIRDGGAHSSAGTEAHLHGHMMVPDGTGRVESPFYKGVESEVESNARAIVFEKLRTGTPQGDLSPVEFALVQKHLTT